MSFVAPRLRDPEAVALASSAARLATTARYLYDEAAYRRRPDAPEPRPRPSDVLRHRSRRGPGRARVRRRSTRRSRGRSTLPDARRRSRRGAAGGRYGVARGRCSRSSRRRDGPTRSWCTCGGARGGDATMAIEPLTGRTRVADRYVDARARPGRPTTPADDRARRRRRAPRGAAAEHATVADEARCALREHDAARVHAARGAGRRGGARARAREPARAPRAQHRPDRPRSACDRGDDARTRAHGRGRRRPVSRPRGDPRATSSWTTRTAIPICAGSGRSSRRRCRTFARSACACSAARKSPATT